MLEPNVIPRLEPILRVGIVLPHDDFDQIILTLPASNEYHILADGKSVQEAVSSSGLVFNLNGTKVAGLMNDQVMGEASVWRIEPQLAYTLGNHVGIEAENIISGREFHWKKFINVFLPGSIEISSRSGHLLMINELPIEEYLACVATSEMGSACPPALIESQTIAARSWMLANVEMKHRDLGFDVCNDDCCQRYQGTTHLTSQSLAGAMNTRGQVLIYEGRICDARYSKSCGGVMETFENLWENTPLGYMQPLADAPADFTSSLVPLDSEDKVREWLETSPASFCSPSVIPEKDLQKYLGSVDDEGEYFRWKFEYSQEKLTSLLNNKLNLKIDKIKALEPVKRGYSGRLTSIKIVYLQDGKTVEYILNDQYEIRRCFHDSFLYSSAFVIDTKGITDGCPGTFMLTGGGWGHGAGYCQIGAVGMSLKGYSTDQILYHYFPGSKLEKIYK